MQASRFGFAAAIREPHEAAVVEGESHESYAQLARDEKWTKSVEADALWRQLDPPLADADSTFTATIRKLLQGIDY